MKPKQIIVGLLLLVISSVATQVKGQIKEMPSDHIMAVLAILNGEMLLLPMIQGQRSNKPGHNFVLPKLNEMVT